LVISRKLLLSGEMNMTVEMSKINPIGIMLVKTLEDGCVYQEVYFGAAISAYYIIRFIPNSYKPTEVKTSQQVRTQLENYFNSLGYYEASEIINKQARKKSNWSRRKSGVSELTGR